MTEVERVFRDVYGQAVATLVRVFGDISLAEDAVQDAFVVASEQWRDAIPPNPAGWIVTTARRRAIDGMRRETRGKELLSDLARADPPTHEDAQERDQGPVKDDQLRLMFTCCHPALRTEHQIALTLRLLGGLGVDEIARSFLVTEAAMAKRLVRAKYKIKAANIPYRIPEDEDLPGRLRSVLAVVYLIYNTGLDDPARGSLRTEALRLGRSLAALMPEELETAGLLALLLLNEARVPARRIGDAVVLLRDQDRDVWDRALIEEGHAIVRSCVRHNQPGPYQLQASIQAVHCDAATFADTDWAQIVSLYDHLLQFLPTAVVRLNRAIALGEVAGPGQALLAMDAVAPELAEYHLLHAARGQMLRRLGRLAEARHATERAAALAPTEPERRFLVKQLGELRSHTEQV